MSDQDRQRAVDELTRHCHAGRLDIDAFSERVAEALHAETLAELDLALRDLPRVLIPDPDPHPPVFALAGRRGRRSATPRRSSDPLAAGSAHPAWQSSLVLAVSLVVLAVSAALVASAQWGWAAAVFGSWLAGLVQGRVPPRRRR